MTFPSHLHSQPFYDSRYEFNIPNYIRFKRNLGDEVVETREECNEREKWFHHSHDHEFQNRKRHKKSKPLDHGMKSKTILSPKPNNKTTSVVSPYLKTAQRNSSSSKYGKENWRSPKNRANANYTGKYSNADSVHTIEEIHKSSTQKYSIASLYDKPMKTSRKYDIFNANDLNSHQHSRSNYDASNSKSASPRFKSPTILYPGKLTTSNSKAISTMIESSSLSEKDTKELQSHLDAILSSKAEETFLREKKLKQIRLRLESEYPLPYKECASQKQCDTIQNSHEAESSNSSSISLNSTKEMIESRFFSTTQFGWRKRLSSPKTLRLATNTKLSSPIRAPTSFSISKEISDEGVREKSISPLFSHEPFSPLPARQKPNLTIIIDENDNSKNYEVIECAMNLDSEKAMNSEVMNQKDSSFDQDKVQTSSFKENFDSVLNLIEKSHNEVSEMEKLRQIAGTESPSYHHDLLTSMHRLESLKKLHTNSLLSSQASIEAKSTDALSSESKTTDAPSRVSSMQNEKKQAISEHPLLNTNSQNRPQKLSHTNTKSNWNENDETSCSSILSKISYSLDKFSTKYRDVGGKTLQEPNHSVRKWNDNEADENLAIIQERIENNIRELRENMQRLRMNSSSTNNLEFFSHRSSKMVLNRVSSYPSLLDPSHSNYLPKPSHTKPSMATITSNPEISALKFNASTLNSQSTEFYRKVERNTTPPSTFIQASSSDWKKSTNLLREKSTSGSMNNQITLPSTQASLLTSTSMKFTPTQSTRFQQVSTYTTPPHLSSLQPQERLHARPQLEKAKSESSIFSFNQREESSSYFLQSLQDLRTSRYV